MTASGVELESRGRLPLAGGRTRSMPNLSRKPLLSIDETAILLGENRATCYRAIKTGTFPLPVIVLGGRLKVPRRAVERLLDGLPPQALSRLDRAAGAPSLPPQTEVCVASSPPMPGWTV